MAEGLNRVQLLGNLCEDGILRMTPGGSAVLKLRLATNESYVDRNKQRQERTEYHSVVLWGKRAEALAKILSKGSRLFIEGGLRTSSYDDRDGNKRYKTEIVATNVLLQGGGERRRSEPGGYEDGSSGPSRDDGYDAPPDDDDIPF